MFAGYEDATLFYEAPIGSVQEFLTPTKGREAGRGYTTAWRVPILRDVDGRVVSLTIPSCGEFTFQYGDDDFIESYAGPADCTEPRGEPSPAPTTSAPTPSPSPSPTPAPTTSAPTPSPTPAPSQCLDSPTWTYKGKEKKACDWVARSPQTRCNLKDESSRRAWSSSSICTCGP